MNEKHYEGYYICHRLLRRILFLLLLFCLRKIGECLGSFEEMGLCLAIDWNLWHQVTNGVTTLRHFLFLSSLSLNSLRIPNSP